MPIPLWKRIPRALGRRVREVRWTLADRRFRTAGLLCVEIDCPANGFFAQLGSILPILTHCKEQGLTPYILLTAKTYTDPQRGRSFLEYFFEGPALTPYQQTLIHSLPIRRVERFSDLPYWDRRAHPSLHDSLDFLNLTYRLRTEFREEARRFARDHFGGKPTLSVHFRGTDKSSEATVISFSDVAACIRACLRLHPNLRTIFIATDSSEFLQFAQRELREYSVVSRNDELRSGNDQPVHYSSEGRPYEKACDALMNALILAEGQVLLKTMSNLSGWSKVFNPAIQVYLINRPDKSGIEWLGFPEKEMVESQWFLPTSRVT